LEKQAFERGLKVGVFNWSKAGHFVDVFTSLFFKDIDDVIGGDDPEEMIVFVNDRSR